jgi:hypothetical protein
MLQHVHALSRLLVSPRVPTLLLAALPVALPAVVAARQALPRLLLLNATLPPLLGS